MKVLIVEDETAAYENMAEVLREADPSVEILGNTESVTQTVEWLEHNVRPDLIFMDIHLSDGSAFMIFDKVKVDVPVVFTTAYDRYALDAFRVNSIDYLLKPVKVAELRRALDKFSRWMPSELCAYLTHMAALSPGRPAYRGSLLVPYRDKLIPVAVADIAFFYSTNKQTTVWLRDGRQYPYSKSLDQIIALLNPSRFIRANKQFIVSRDSVENITIWFDNRLLVNLGTATPEPVYVSKNRAPAFKEWLTEE